MIRAKLNLFIALLFIFIGFQGHLFAQKVTFSASNIDFDGYENLKVIGQDSAGFFILQSNLSLNNDRERIGFRTRKYQIAYYTKDLKPIWTKKIEPPDRNINTERPEFVKNKILTVFSNIVDGDLQFILKWLNTQSPEKENLHINLTFDLGKSSGYSKPEFIISKNQNLFGLIFTETTGDNEQVLHYAVLNLDLKIVKQTKYKIADKQNRLSLLETELANNGDVMVLTELYSNKNNRLEENRNVAYQLLTIPFSKSTFGKKEISFDEKLLVKPSIRFDPVQNKGVFLCLFYNPNLITESGIFYTQVNLNENTFENDKQIDLNNNLHVKLISSEYDNDIRGLSDYKIHQIILRNDGGAVILAEAAYQSEYSYYDYFTQSYTRRTEYYFANIFLASINIDGTLDWYKVIKKSQYSRDDEGIYSSFLPIIASQEIVMMLNTQLNRNNEVMAYAINNSGEDYQKLIIDAKEHILLLPTLGKQISSSTVIIPVMIKKKLALAKFEF